ncbi:MAG: FeoB-associated Cys-rich membrane protein [Clostridiales Family XIII bacterium]|jgi:hypothetical protein|nr:FeoB-associated Cys-rich membrane protein [Clostridiales Family XIII bacterium]
MNGTIGTIIILAVVAIIVALAVRSVIKTRKKGGSCSCGCEGCSLSEDCSEPPK